ncbi:MAG: hypothetical protein NXI24_18285 [bacterium]|nr:hypothetical protein [bacterium]
MRPLPHHILNRVTPYIPHELIPDEQLARIRTAHETLPDYSTVAAGFEIRLGDGAPSASQVDSFAAVSADPQSRDAFATILNPPDEHSAACENIADRAIVSSHAWQRVCQFCDDWRQSNSPLHDITHLWLEFDHADEADAHPTSPAPSLIYAPPVPQEPNTANSDATDTSALRTQRALDLLLGESETTDAIAANYLRCEAALGSYPGARIKHAGVMLPRKIQAVRIVIENLAAQDLPEYLERIGWPGDFARLRTFLHEYKPYLTQTLVDLDLSETLYPNLGIEISFPQAEIDRWPGFLQTLVDRGLCCPKKAAALAGWIGPYGLEIPELETPKATAPILWRTLNHVKLTLGSDGQKATDDRCVCSAKAYLGYIAGRRPPQLLKVEHDHPSRLRTTGDAGAGRLYDYLPGPPTPRRAAAAVHDGAGSADEPGPF